jgi:RND family efflux transporter MFP subunit
VERGDISNSILINGDVLAAREVSIFPVVAGKIVELRLRVGDRVEEGQVVAVIDPSRPGEVYSGSPVRSTIKGTVLQAPYSIGDTVSQQSAVYVVGDLSTLVVETFVPERFSSNIRTGQTAGFFFDSMPGESFAGVVSEVSPVLDPASRTLRIRLRFERNDPRIRPGMFATVRLVTASRRNVMVIPRAAIINTYNTWIVFIVNPENAAERREISLGLESETMVEVLGGLLIGDLVIISGQNFLSNGEPVRVLDENPNQ